MKFTTEQIESATPLFKRTMKVINADDNNLPDFRCPCRGCNMKTSIFYVAFYFPEKLSNLLNEYEPKFSKFEHKIKKFYDNACIYGEDDDDLKELDEKWAIDFNKLIHDVNKVHLN